MLMPGRYIADTGKKCVTVNTTVLVPVYTKVYPTMVTAPAPQQSGSGTTTPIHKLPKPTSAVANAPYIYHYNAASTHPNNTVISGALVNNMSQWSISLSDEPSGGVSAFMHIQADTNLEAQEVGFELDLPENVYAELCVRQYVDTGEEYTNVVAWTTINTSGAQSFMVPINKAYVQAGGPTILQMTFRTIGNVNLGTGTATQWKNYYTYLSHYVSQTHIATICEEKDNYRFGFNGQEKDNEIKGIGNSLDFKFRGYDSRLGRWLSVDPLAAKYPTLSPYNFVGNTPIQAIDPDGKDIYILFYSSGNKRGDEMFRASALTRKYDIEHGKGFDPSRDKVVVLRVQDLASIKKQVDNVVKTLSPKYGETAEFGLWSHAALEGPVGTSLTSEDAVGGKQMSLSGWSKINFNWKNGGDGAQAVFYGCRTGVNSYVPDGKGSPLTQKWKEKGSFAKSISGLSNFSGVNVSGQTSSAFPSMYTNYRKNSENGTDNFINSDDGNTVNFQRTYMVGGVKRSEDWNSNEQNVANPMQNNVNGQTTGTSYQSGTTR